MGDFDTFAGSCGVVETITRFVSAKNTCRKHFLVLGTRSVQCLFTYLHVSISILYYPGVFTTLVHYADVQLS